MGHKKCSWRRARRQGRFASVVVVCVHSMKYIFLHSYMEEDTEKYKKCHISDSTTNDSNDTNEKNDRNQCCGRKWPGNASDVEAIEAKKRVRDKLVQQEREELSDLNSRTFFLFGKQHWTYEFYRDFWGQDGLIAKGFCIDTGRIETHTHFPGGDPLHGDSHWKVVYLYRSVT